MQFPGFLLVVCYCAPIRSVLGFGIPAKYHASHRIATTLSSPARKPLGYLLAKSSDEDGVSKGMEDAFSHLEGLKGLGGEDDPFSVPEKKQKQDEAFAKAMQELDLKDIQDIEPPTPESEAKLYKELLSEVEGKTEDDLMATMATVKSEMDGGSSSKTEFPQFDPTMRDTDKFMEKALDEALKEAKKKADVEINTESLLDNKEIMKEISAIFDKGNDQLLEGLEEIRAEQMALAKESAERNAKVSVSRIEEDEQRLALAESNMKKMLTRVNKETKAVEEAIGDLKKMSDGMETGVESQLSGLKTGGMVKQATLVGALLFSVRSGIESIAFMGGDATHLMPAVIQGVIAVICLVAFIFIK